MRYTLSPVPSSSVCLRSCCSTFRLFWCVSHKASAVCFLFFFFSSRRRHTRCSRDWSSDVCSSDLNRANYADHLNIFPQFKPLSEAYLAQRIQRIAEIQFSSVPVPNADKFPDIASVRSEERRVGKECRSRWSPYH